jgi:ABC-2 type transport system permease protein
MATEPSSKPSFTPGRRWTVGFDVAVRTVVVLAVVVMTNYLAGRFFHREYLSPHTRTELSPRTVNLVQSLTNQVKVTLYYDRENELFSTISALLREYQALNPKIRVEVVDYLRDAAAAQRVKLAYQLPEMAKDEEKNFIVFDGGKGYKAVNGNLLADYQVEVDKEKGKYDKRPTFFKGEMLFNSLLLAMTNPKPLNAYVLQGHGEHNLESGDEVNGYLGFKSVLEQNYIKVELLTLLGTNTVPQDCNLLIVPGPRTAIPEDELEKIDQYLKEGGRMFVLFNAASTERMSGLERILYGRWNILVSENIVQDPENSLNTLKSAPGADIAIGAFSEHPAVKALIGYNLDLIYPRPVLPTTPSESSADAPKVTVLFATQPTATLVKNPKVKPRSYPLAVAVERPAVAGVVTGRGTTRMIVVGDSFFLANGPMKLVANRDFASYAVNWLVERSQFVEGVGPQPIKEYRIALTVSQMNTIQWLLLAALPGGILLFGGLVWLRRQK